MNLSAAIRLTAAAAAGLKPQKFGNSLLVLWLGLCGFTAKSLGSIPGQGAKMLQATWHGQSPSLPPPPKRGEIYPLIVLEAQGENLYNVCPLTAGGPWWLLVVTGGLWWPLVITGGQWWLMVVRGGPWWWLVAAGGRWWPLVVTGGLWWLLVVTGGRWWLMVVPGG